MIPDNLPNPSLNATFSVFLFLQTLENPKYELIIEAQDMAGMDVGLTGTATATILIDDKNDHAPKFTKKEVRPSHGGSMFCLPDTCQHSLSQKQNLPLWKREGCFVRILYHVPILELFNLKIPTCWENKDAKSYEGFSENNP